MHANPFEYEERYKVTDPDAVQAQLEAAGYAHTGTETQTDHWFIPRRIMSPEQQAHWFDHEHGYAVRIREQTTPGGSKAVITTKQLLREADHSAMTNNERPLSRSGMIEALSPIGDEFRATVAELGQRTDDMVTITEAQQLILRAGRKEYLVFEKQRRTFHNPAMPNVVVDIDTIPALQTTSLGFWSSIEFEYSGAGTPEEAKRHIGSICRQLGYRADDILAKALPGLAIPYLARF